MRYKLTVNKYNINLFLFYITIQIVPGVTAWVKWDQMLSSFWLYFPQMCFSYPHGPSWNSIHCLHSVNMLQRKYHLLIRPPEVMFCYILLTSST
jgi:hypothetical protein